MANSGSFQSFEGMSGLQGGKARKGEENIRESIIGRNKNYMQLYANVHNVYV